MSVRRAGMVIVAMAVAAMTATTVAGSSAATDSITVTKNTSDTRDGYFYTFWKDTAGNDASLTLTSPGRYSTSWDIEGNFYAGVGWNPGSRRTVSYTGTFAPQGNAFLSLYGWARNPSTEYYIVENYGTYNPGSGATRLATIVSDGGTYDIYRSHVAGWLAHGASVGKASIIDSSYDRYWSVRTVKRSSGTITVANHFDAWAKFGFDADELDFQILATEGYMSAGTSDIAIQPVGCAAAGSASSGASVSPLCTAPATTTTSSTTTSSTTRTPKTRTPKVVTSTTVTKCRTAKKGAITCKVITKRTRVPAPG